MTSRHFKFFIEGPPPVKRRARGRTFYTPAKTKADEKRVKDAFLSLYPEVRSEQPFQVEIYICFKKPKKSLFNYPAEDGDNVEKAILDGLALVLWENDRQVTSCMWFEFFENEEQTEGVWVVAHEK